MTEPPQARRPRKGRLGIDVLSVEDWAHGPGFDAYSGALVAVQRTFAALEALLEEDERRPGEPTESTQAWRLRVAVEATFGDLEPAQREALTRDAATVLNSYSQFVFERIREEKPEFRTISRETRLIAERDGGARGEYQVNDIVNVTLSLRRRDTERLLINPLIAAITPYVAADRDPVIAAHDLGLCAALTRDPKEVVREALLVSLMSALETFVNSVTEASIVLNPTLLRGSGITFTAEQVLDAKGRRQLKQEIQSRILERHTRNWPSREKFLVSTLGQEASTKSFSRWIGMRNALVHGEGLWSDEHLKSLEGTEGIRPGDRVIVTRTDLHRLVSLGRSFATHLVALARTYADS